MESIKTKDMISRMIYRGFFKAMPILALFLFLMSCGGSQGVITAEERQELQELTQKVESREFEIQNQWADPQGGNSINLMGNTNFIRFEGETVEVFLPYYGVRHSGGGPGSEGGIKYEGPLVNYKVEERMKQQDVLVSFEGQNKDNEQLKFLITLYPNGNATTSVTTSQRSSITYRGDLED